MKLRIFQSAQGDCLLLESQDEHLMLCDGGMSSSFRAHVRESLGALRDDDRELDYVYVSHIDNDHITGVLQLLQDEVEWRIFDYQESIGNPDAEAPEFPRPPVIKGLLHNSFRDQIGVNAKDVEDLLAAAVPSLFATADPRLVDVALELQEVATAVPEAIKVSRLAASDALDIPINRIPGTVGPAKLLFFRDTVQTFDVGSMRFTIVGPGAEELESLKTGWVNWLRANKVAVREIRKELKRRVEEFSNGAEGPPLFLADWNGVPNYEGVTAPNIASLMFMVEEAGKRLLLTGDSQQDKIIEGLQRTGFLAGAGLHVDVLKVQHHGSENNLDANFARQVSADHYVFCGNGLHGNPSLDVIDVIFASRCGTPAELAIAPAAIDRTFHFWFSTTSAAQDDGTERQEVMRAVEERVAEHRVAANGRLIVHYNEADSIELPI